MYIASLLPTKIKKMEKKAILLSDCNILLTRFQAADVPVVAVGS